MTRGQAVHSGEGLLQSSAKFPGCPGTPTPLPPAPEALGRPEEERGRRRGPDGTYLLSLHSFRSLTRSHLRRRKRLRRGEALGVEQLDHGVSSSLEGVISMDGSCRNSLPGAKTPGRSPLSPASRLGSCTFLVRRILKRRRRSVGVDELDQTGLPSGAPRGSGTCRAGGCRLSIMLAAGMGPAASALPRCLVARRPGSPALARGARPLTLGNARRSSRGQSQLVLRSAARAEGARGLAARPPGFELGDPQPPGRPLRGSPRAPSRFPSAALPRRLATVPEPDSAARAPRGGSANSQWFAFGRLGWGAGLALQGGREREEGAEGGGRRGERERGSRRWIKTKEEERGARSGQGGGGHVCPEGACTGGDS